MKFISLAILSVAFASPAFATNNQDHTCQGGNNCNTQGGGGTSTSNSDADASANALAVAAQGQLQGQQQGQQQGQIGLNLSSNDNTATGGSASVGGVGNGLGNFSPSSEVGDVKATVGNVSSNSGPSTSTSTSSNTGLSNNKLEGGDASASVGFSGNSNVDTDVTAYGVKGDVEGGDAVAFGGQGGDSESNSGVFASGNSYNDVDTKVTTTDLNNVNTTDVNVVEGDKLYNDSESSSVALGGYSSADNKNLNSDVNVVEGDKNTQIQGQNTSVEGNDVNVSVGNGEQPLAASSQSSETSVQVEGDEGDVTQVDARDQSVTTYEAPIIPVNTAAASFSSICTSGAGRQTNTYGISLAVTSDTCTHLMMADAYMALGDTAQALKHVRAAGRHATFKGWFGYARHAITLGVL